ncbi:MAG: 16S rRNA (adenine(1518)-N(6)/adenine(1519)-N(6))-dimethyltransferase RsmA [Eggerthellaceae bacterium]
MTDRLSPLASVPATREVLEAHGLATKKALGQHFLINDGIVRHICDLAELVESDRVLEIGPGIGTLTVALLQCSGAVTAIERDSDLPPVLARTCARWQDRFTLINRDALEVMPSDLTYEPNKLVSNLPYAVAATLVLDYFERFESLESATVMVQAEVADRMAAKPGTKNYGAFTVKLSLFAQPAGRFQVSPGNFFPPPRVNSAVLRLDRVPCRDMSPQQRKATMVMADAAFANRRKTISNSCRTYFSGVEGAPDLLSQVFGEAGIDPRRRGESLELAEFKALGAAALDLGLVSLR